MPSIATTNAAIPTLAPRSRADSATSGRIAPAPIETNSVGPYTGTATCRQLNESEGSGCIARLSCHATHAVPARANLP